MKKTLFYFILFFVISGWSQSNELNLMPWPQEVVLGNSKFEIQPNFTIVVHQEKTKRIEIATTKFMERLSGRTGVFFENG